MDLKNRCINCCKEVDKPIAKVFLKNHPVFKMQSKRPVCSQVCLDEALKWGFKISKDFRRDTNVKK